MTGSPNFDIRQTFDAWFDVTIKVLQKKIAILGVRRTGSLFNSLEKSIGKASANGISGQLSYNVYGKFVDMGVGRNFSKGNSGDVAKVRVQRKRKEWQSKIFYAQVMRLGEIYKQKYGQETANQMVAMIQAVNDLKASAYKN